MDTSIDGSKKTPIEDLSKEELIKKYRSIVAILQKAKQNHNLLTEENEQLKSQIGNPDVPNAAAENIIEKLIQQKLTLVTDLDSLRTQKELINDKLTKCESTLKTEQEKVAELDTENQSHQRQVNRLTEENDQLLNHLDILSKQTEELKKIGLEQNQQLLALEKQNDISLEFLENAKIVEVLQVECDSIKKNNLNLLQENNELVKQNAELIAKIESTKAPNEEDGVTTDNELVKKCDLIAEVESLKIRYGEAEITINSLKNLVQEKTKQNETYLSTTDDLNTELHKNKAMVEKLQDDISRMTKTLSNSQIESSCVESDLLNTNEKLKEKLYMFRTKIIKFAGDVKSLKLEKVEVLNTFKNYVEQVKLWETQLKEFADTVLCRFEEFEKEKLLLKSEVESFKSQLEEMEVKNFELLKINSELGVTKEELKIKIESLENEKLETSKDSGVMEELNECKKQLDELREQEGLYKEKNASELILLQNQQEHERKTLKLEIETLQQEYKERFKSQEIEIERLTLNLECKLSELSSQAKENENLSKENENLQNRSLGLSTQCDNQNQKIEELENELASLKSSIDKVTSEASIEMQENRKLTEINKDIQNEITQLDDQLAKSKFENTELLKEMNEMNQVLKERGETISKQQEYCEELLKNATKWESQNKNVEETLREKEEIITNLQNNVSLLKDETVNQATTSINEMHEIISKKNEEIVQLQNELTIMKEKLQTSLDTSHDTNYAESENMSTSTISKTEEMSRIKDLEGSWEEKYGKLRNLALKLKTKIRDQTTELSREQNEKVDLQQKLSSSLKTIQTLQAQYDKLQDELDRDALELKDYNRKLNGAALDISNNKQQLANNDELIGKLKNDIEILNKEKLNTENWKKQVSGKVQNLRKELEANNVLKKEFENQISKLNALVEVKEKALKDEIEKHNSTRNSLQELNNDFKKQSVLNLEMHDYERSLKDLTQKLEEKQELITKLKDQTDSQRASLSTAKEQNRVMEDSIQLAENDVSLARNDLQVCKKNIQELEAAVSQKDEKLQNLTRMVEGCRAENEDLSMQLSKVVADNQKLQNAFKIEKDYLSNQNVALEQKAFELEDSIKSKEDELQRLSVEFQGYKVRAQSVFRQNQTRDIGMEEKLTEEVSSFKAQIEILQQNLNEVRDSLKQSAEENGKLHSEKEKIEVKFQELERKYEECRSEFESLSHKHQKAVSENAETVRSLKVHSETLSQCYRQQIAEQEIRHNREVIELQSKMEKAAPLPEVPQFSTPTVPREQGEGSENVENAFLNTRPVPLDRLLSNESDQDVGFIKQQVMENETKVAHLTALLADTEQDLAKHVQMNKLLKEEIRRQQRSVEREQHAENLEYLKNVVFKFATLTSGDERSRLVPVLNTILKFSPEESSQLNLVAKGDFTSRGWSNYLPSWPTTGRPQ